MRAWGELDTSLAYLSTNYTLALDGIVLGKILKTQSEDPYTYHVLLPEATSQCLHLPYDTQKDWAFVRAHSDRHILPPKYQIYLEAEEIDPGTATGYDAFLHSSHGCLNYWITILYMSQLRALKDSFGTWTQQLNELLPRRVLGALDTTQEILPTMEPEGGISLTGVPIGLVPDITQVDDVLVVFKGHASPMVLRKTESSQSSCLVDHVGLDEPVTADWTYQVIGEAYVPQFADGMALVNEKLPRKQFKLV